MPTPLITLTTDFGTGSFYVAQLKGVLASRSPQSTCIDVTHDIPPQNIPAGSWILGVSFAWFPGGTIHVAVVDPGVGSSRRIIYASCAGHHFILPDNGLITGVAERATIDRVRVLDRPEFWLAPVSSTFHGRDVMAPVAAALACGTPPEQVGSPTDAYEVLESGGHADDGSRLHGQVLIVDRFGNVITDISAARFAPFKRAVRVVVRHGDAQRCASVVTTYSDAQAGELVALVGSSGQLEFAEVNGSAARRMGLTAGDRFDCGYPEKADDFGPETT